MKFDESKHPREKDGKFTDGSGSYDSRDDFGNIRRKVNSKLGNSKREPVLIDMDTEVQKQIEAAKTPKERQAIAFRYIMDNLRGQYEASDGRTVSIERVGADKMTYRDNRNKLRVCPVLAEMIKAGEYDHSAPAEEKSQKKFDEFSYYKVRVKIGHEVYVGMLNVGIRKDGSSTLYDLRPFYKEDK